MRMFACALLVAVLYAAGIVKAAPACGMEAADQQRVTSTLASPRASA